VFKSHAWLAVVAQQAVYLHMFLLLKDFHAPSEETRAPPADCFLQFAAAAAAGSGAPCVVDNTVVSSEMLRYVSWLE